MTAAFKPGLTPAPFYSDFCFHIAILPSPSSLISSTFSWRLTLGRPAGQSGKGCGHNGVSLQPKSLVEEPGILILGKGKGVSTTTPSSLPWMVWEDKSALDLQTWGGKGEECGPTHSETPGSSGWIGSSSSGAWTGYSLLVNGTREAGLHGELHFMAKTGKLPLLPSPPHTRLGQSPALCNWTPRGEL